MVDLDVPVTQAEFGALVGITQQAVSDLQGRDVLRKGDTARAWLLAYCEQLRAVAAGRDPDGELATERARVSRATADKIEMANAITRREYAPVSVLEVVLGDVARRVSTRLDAMVPQIKRRLPDINASALAMIAAEVAECRAICAAVNIADADRIDAADEDEPAEAPDAS